MKKTKKWGLLLISGVLALAIALGVMAFSPAQDVQAQSDQRGLPPFGHGPGRGGKADAGQALADALGISLEELQAAQEQAQAVMLEQAVADGKLSQEEADLITARKALNAAIDHDEVMATALGITVEELQAAHADGTRLQDLISELGLEPAEVRAALQTAYQTAVDDAVAQGVVTQEQADQILSGPGAGKPGMPFPGRGGFPGKENRGKFPGRGFGPCPGEVPAPDAG